MSRYNAKAMRKYRAANKDKLRVYELNWARANGWRAIFKTARARAIKEGVPFTLTYDDIPAYEGCVCPVFGIKLERGKRPWCPSLDRIVPSRGYIKGNVIVVSYFVNRVKNDATLPQLMKIADFYRQYLEETDGPSTS